MNIKITYLPTPPQSRFDFDLYQREVVRMVLRAVNTWLYSQG